MPAPSTDTFFSKCIPAMRTDFQPCIGLTDCNISPTTVDELASIYADTSGRFRIMGALLDTDIMGKACMIRENSLYDFVMQNAKHWGMGVLNTRKKMNSGLIDVVPFVIVGREGIINNNYWAMTGGVAGAANSPGTGSAYTLRINASSMSSIPLSVDWFSVGTQIFISGRGATGAGTLTDWTIVDAVDIGTSIQLYLSSNNAGSKLPSYKTETPLIGVGLRGVPNVSPYERYCVQVPRLNTETSYPAFVQNTRWTLCSDELTQKFLQHLEEGNPLYRTYYRVEEAKANKQVITDFQNRLVHTFLFNTALPGQNVTDWDTLAQITSWTDNALSGSSYGIQLPGVEGRCVARRANAEGVYPQLYECGRVKDLFGQRLNLPELQAELYQMQRLRDENGHPNPGLFEIVVDSAYRPLFIQALVRYQQAKYEGAARYNIEVEDTVTNAGFVFRDFKMDYPPGSIIRVVSHYALDDLLTAHTTVSSTLTSIGRKAWILDWNTIYMAILESRSVNRRTGTAEEIAKINEGALCVVDIPTKSMKINTMLFTTVVDCPKASLWIENFSFEVPEHQVAVGNPADLYGDYLANNTAFP